MEREIYLRTNGGILLLKTHRYVLRRKLFVSLKKNKHLKIVKHTSELGDGGPMLPGYIVLDTRLCSEVEADRLHDELNTLKPRQTRP